MHDKELSLFASSNIIGKSLTDDEEFGNSWLGKSSILAVFLTKYLIEGPVRPPRYKFRICVASFLIG